MENSSCLVHGSQIGGSIHVRASVSSIGDAMLTGAPTQVQHSRFGMSGRINGRLPFVLQVPILRRTPIRVANLAFCSSLSNSKKPSTGKPFDMIKVTFGNMYLFTLEKLLLLGAQNQLWHLFNKFAERCE